MSTPVIDLTNISAGFNATTVLDGLSLQAAKGALVLIEGPIGSGKTTLMKVLTGSLPLLTGLGRVAGLNLPGISAGALTTLRRREGIVFQAPRFLENDSVLTNVALPLAIAGASRSDCRSKGTRALLDAGLASHARKRPEELSGGEQARLQIARALIHSPFLLLADEPLAHLDPESAQAAEAMIAKAHERGTTVLVTTHRPTHLAAKAQRYQLERGRLYPN